MPRWFAVWTLLLALASAGIMTWTAGLGGQIRHSEIRQDGGTAGAEEARELTPTTMRE